ncbi:MAG: leader peptidase (prepilin peptidase) / N-methyltransferase [Solirubrobacteraceae bacterium]|jgi:leader peptidase (prepilin peptidase)/N-methyltransferase|nr:leader peptidase (prepilin peptidase) / N-methyltransferase [Solirubrobacteraceae bacterium]
MPVAIAAVAGLLAGSFFNVVIARLPRHESLLRPRSRCPHCGHPVRPYDNVPVVSWLILRGRCRDCGEPISARYPLVELLTAALFAAVVIDTGANEHVWLGLALVAVLVPVAFIDLDHRIIPNAIVLPGAVAAIAIVAATEPSELAEHLIAGAAAAGFLLVAVLAYPRGMGMGDVKLAGVLGLYLGRSVGPAMLVALLSGTIVGVVIIARKGAAEGRKTAVPFGPFLALGGLVGLFFGPDIVDWYLDSFT